MKGDGGRSGSQNGFVPQAPCTRLALSARLRERVAFIGIDCRALQSSDDRCRALTFDWRQPGTPSMLAPRKVLHSTPAYVLKAAFAIAELRPTDLLLDVGCGDGRALVAAALQIGSRGIGWEINPERSAEAVAAVHSAGLDERIAIHTGNVLSDAEPQLWGLFGSLLRGEVPATRGVAKCDGLVVLLYLTEYGVRKLLPLFLEAAARRDPALGPIRVLSYVYPFPRECARGSAPRQFKHWCADPENPDRSFPLFLYAFQPGAPPALDEATTAEPVAQRPQQATVAAAPAQQEARAANDCCDDSATGSCWQWSVAVGAALLLWSQWRPHATG